MAKFSTPSVRYREQGNEIFTKLQEQKHAAPVALQGRFTDALKYYNQALNTSVNDDERASAYKNLGVLFAYQITSSDIQSVNRKELDYNLKECITSYGSAFRFGRTTKSEEWLTSINRQINDFVYDCCASFLMLPTEEHLRVFHFITNCFERTDLKKLDSVATVYYSLGQLTFEKAVKYFKDEPRLIYDCQPYLDRALYWACELDSFRSTDLEELRSSIWLHQCMHESANARRIGVRMLKEHLENDEHLNMDVIWTIIDKFREAILLAKEHDIEGKEARACHHTAVVYEKVLKMTDTAYNYHLRCITLAQTLVPRNLTTHDWYVISSSFVEQYRAKKVYEEEAVNEELKKKFRIELALELKELDKKAEKGICEFLEHIYNKYPPRKAGATMGSTDSNELSKTVKKAILHYHPDSQSTFNDAKWTFLCTEITKILNIKYGLLD
ncbi:unnamed protein product [Rotaria sp. Silwood1]|nr:unnamed protein product [Rotaria sp. Silwood1]CAF1547881.1 unnamed protein product [Rotaria sp. Silwood1]CAF3634580.1 unnamed protein product [Rotaria sp. Silwood1]CAF4538412.1 unnamed protein product [Rotaria sp. Silwood1]